MYKYIYNKYNHLLFFSKRWKIGIQILKITHCTQDEFLVLNTYISSFSRNSDAKIYIICNKYMPLESLYHYKKIICFIYN